MSRRVPTRRTTPILPATPDHAHLWDALDAADTVPPCQGSKRHRWTSEDPLERHEAAHACLACPAIAACATAGRSERFAVWGGRDRTPRNRTRADDTDEPTEEGTPA